jgi:acid phosphatase family membrane protein YuiD
VNVGIKVLVSATAACLIGQLSKPLASALLGKGFKWGLALKSGGMPSTHSAVSALSYFLSLKFASLPIVIDYLILLRLTSKIFALQSIVASATAIGLER